MAGEIKQVGIELTAAGVHEFKSSMREVKAATSELYSELKLAQSQYDKNTSVTDKLKDRQKYLTASTEEYKKKLEILESQLKDMESAEKKDEAAISKKKAEINNCKAKINEYEKALKDVNNQLTTHSAQLKEWGDKLQAVGGKITDVGKGLSAKVTAPLVAVGALGVKKFAEVDKTMQLTNSTMGNTAEEAELLNKAMKDAAANSTFGMSDAATATLNFARAGLDAEQASAALAPAMNLAAGEGGNLDTVSAGLVATINGFHGSFDDAGKYADVFAAACNNSALDVDSLSNAMSVAAPIFSAAGYSVNDAALYMGVMANNGIEADKAANSLKTGIARLVSPAKEGADMMDKLGISITNSDGSMKSSVQVQSELHDAFSKLSESEQIAAASAIFGKNQMAPWLALINSSPADVLTLDESLAGASMTIGSFSEQLSQNGFSLDDMKEKLAQLGISGTAVESAFNTSGGSAEQFAFQLALASGDTENVDLVLQTLGMTLEDIQTAMDGTKGTTEEMADAMMSGFGGSLEKLKSSIDVAATSLGEALAPAIQKAADFVQDLVDKFNALDPEQQQTIATIGAVVAAIGPLLVIIGTVITSIGSIMSGIGAVTGAIGTLTGGAGIAALLPAIGGIVTAAAPFLIGGAIIAGIVAGVIFIVKHWDEIKEKAGELKEAIVEKWEGLVEGTKEKWESLKEGIAEKASSAFEAASEKFDSLKEGAQSTWQDMKDGASEKLGDMWDTASGIFDDVKGLVDFEWELPDLSPTLVTDAVDTVLGAFDSLKDALDFSWSFPHIDLPHFSWSWNDLGIVSIPSISVDWYAKGGIFDNASIIGVGEAGPEAAIPLSGSRMRPFAQAIAQEMGSNGNDEIISLLKEYLPVLAKMRVYLDSGALVGQLAPAMDAQMGIISARKVRGN